MGSLALGLLVPLLILFLVPLVMVASTWASRRRRDRRVTGPRADRR